MNIRPVALITAALGTAVRAWIALAAVLFIVDICKLKKGGKK